MQHPDIIGNYEPSPPSASALCKTVSHGTRSVPLSRTHRKTLELDRIRAEFAASHEPCALPTQLACGSRAKGDLMTERYEAGLPLHHPDDSTVFAKEAEMEFAMSVGEPVDDDFDTGDELDDVEIAA